MAGLCEFCGLYATVVLQQNLGNSSETVTWKALSARTCQRRGCFFSEKSGTSKLLAKLATMVAVVCGYLQVVIVINIASRLSALTPDDFRHKSQSDVTKALGLPGPTQSPHSPNLLTAVPMNPYTQESPGAATFGS